MQILKTKENISTLALVYLDETDGFLKEKVDAALAEGLQVFFCCGEALELRESGKHLEFVRSQLENSLFHLSAEVIEKNQTRLPAAGFFIAQKR